MSLFLLGKRIHIPVFEQNMMAKIAKKTIQFKFTIYTFVLTWFPHWVAGPWLLMHVPFLPNKELCTLRSGSGASFSWRLGWGSSPQCPAVCTRVVPAHRRHHPSLSRSCESSLLHGTPGAGTNNLLCTMEHFPPAIWLSNLTQNSGTGTYCNRWIWCSKGIFFLVNPGYHDFFVLLFLYLMGEAQQLCTLSMLSFTARCI